MHIEDEALKQIMEKKLQKEKQNFEMHLKNVKPIALRQAVDFVRREADSITTLLTKNHNQLYKKFLEMKQRFVPESNERDQLLENWKITEILLAQKTPVFEAEYALDERTPLSLYDCLVPKLKQQRRLVVQETAKFSIEDFRAKQNALRLEWELE